MRVLYIDTTAPVSHLSLWESEQIRDQFEWESAKKLGSDLLPNIEQLLFKSNITFSELNAIAVNPGPGSFTGTRVGVTTANSLAWSLDIPVLATSKGELPLILKQNEYSKPVVPRYSTPPSITVRKH